MFCENFVGCECFQSKVLVYEKVAGEVGRPPATFGNPHLCLPSHPRSALFLLDIGALGTSREDTLRVPLERLEPTIPRL